MQKHPARRWFIAQKTRIYDYWGLGWSYAAPGGGPVLIEDATWRNINGIRIHTPWQSFWLLFRRRFW